MCPAGYICPMIKPKNPDDPWDRMNTRLFNAASQGSEPAFEQLFEAAKQGDLDAMQAALDAGADLYRQDGMGATLLIWSISMEFPEKSVRFLIGRMDSFDQQDKLGRTALFMAACYGHAQYIRPLIEKGADETIRDKLGKTPAEAAHTMTAGDSLQQLEAAISERETRKLKRIHQAVRSPR